MSSDVADDDGVPVYAVWKDGSGGEDISCTDMVVGYEKGAVEDPVVVIARQAPLDTPFLMANVE